MSFEIDCTNTSAYPIPTITIELIGYFSIDGDSQYCADLSQMKYYIPPLDLNNVNFVLKKNCASTRHKSTSYIKLDNILKWISDNFNLLENPEKPLSAQEERCLDIDFICHRGVLKAILCSLYREYEEWIICASKYRGTIYLCEFYTDEREHQYINRTTTKKQILSQGFKFGQYMVADHPAHKPDPSKHVNECENFYCMFKTKFDNHTLLYEAEIDGISSQQPITDTLIGKTFELIDLKMFSRSKPNGDIDGMISPKQVLQWWSQNYLARVDKIICGLKDKHNEDSSIVRMIKEYPTHKLPNLSRPFCNVDKCKIFCKMFLDNIKRIVTKDYNECMYKFHWKPSAKDVVDYNEETPDNEKYFFLKSWFVDKAEEYANRSQFISTSSEISSGRKLKSLTVSEKLKVIAAVQSRLKPKKDIAAEYSIPASTLSTIIKNEENILARASSGQLKRKRKREAEFPDVEECMLKWFKQCKSSNVSIGGPILKEKAEHFAKSLEHEDFRVSNGRLENFKKRHNIGFKKVCGESASVNENVCSESSEWINKLAYISGIY